MDYPSWYDGRTINEVEFCTEFVQSIPLKCIKNRLYTIDGEISDSEIIHLISVKLTEFVTTGIFRKVKSLLEALKLHCHSEPIVPKEDEIHLLNGVLKTDGTWIPEKRFCINRLNIHYNPDIWNGVYYPDKFMQFLMDLLDLEDIYTLQEYLGYCLIPPTKGQAMLFLIGNGSPKALYDKSDGFARRLLILTTKPKPTYRIDDPYLAEKFIAEKELIFCWMFDGLKRLIKNKFRFTVSAKTKKNVSEAMADNCNIIEFLKDEMFIRFGADFEASGVDLYGGYVLWCSRNALTALKKDTFIAWLHSNEEKYSIKYDTHIKNRNNERVRGFRGIRTSYVPILL